MPDRAELEAASRQAEKALLRAVRQAQHLIDCHDELARRETEGATLKRLSVAPNSTCECHERIDT